MRRVFYIPTRALIIVVCGMVSSLWLSSCSESSNSIVRQNTLNSAIKARVPILPRLDADNAVLVKIGSSFKMSTWHPRESRLRRVQIDANNQVTLRAGVDFVWNQEDIGVQVSLKPSNSPIPQKERYQREYFYLPRTDAENGLFTITLTKNMPPAPEAILQVRNVRDDTQVWRSAAIHLPKNATLSAAYGMLCDWPTEVASKSDFILKIVDCATEAESVVGTYHLAANKPEAASWNNVSIELDQFALRDVFIEMSTIPHTRSSGAPISQAFWALPQISAPNLDAGHEKPNIILISLDTLRADYLSFMGYVRETSPRLAAFAENAVVFENAISPSTWTTPSHASIFTGALPWEHGAGSRYRHYALEEKWVTIAELAREEGYTTAAFTEGGAISGQWGLAQGFEHYDDGPSVSGRRSGVAKQTFGTARDWLTNQASTPFFLFLHTFEIHSPYCSPEPLGTRFAEATNTWGDCIEETTIQSKAMGKQAEDLYDGSISFTDEVLGNFLDDLEANGLLENTVVIITSDHGEEFGEHGKYGHTTHIYPEHIHVPLIVRMPGKSLPGRRIADFVSTRDLHATFAAIFGTPPEKAHDGSLSLVPLIVGANDACGRPYVFSHLPNFSATIAYTLGIEYEFDSFSIIGTNARYMISNRDWILQRIGQNAAIAGTDDWTTYAFDHLTDPHELTNLAATPPARLQQLRTTLIDTLQNAGQLRHSIGPPTMREVQLDNKALEDMEALGYL